MTLLGGQLTGADYDTQDDESYTYDSNGNRTGDGYVVGPNNQLLSDGTHWYEYDAEGNRTLRYLWTDTDADGQVDPGEGSEITEYEWDHRNRLVRVTDRDTETGPATQIVEHTYDYLNRWVARAVDCDGDGSLGFVDTYFVYDGTPGAVSLDRSAVTLDQVGQIVLQFDDDAQGAPQLTHRYLWGAAVDQILADEQVTDPALEGDVLWALTDQLGTVRDLAQYDPATDTTTIGNHRTFDSFGNLLTETNPALDHLFAFTGRAFDASTSLQNNLNRWYDAQTGRWLSQDPIGFEGGDANPCRYVGNCPTSRSDPTGLSWWDVTKATFAGLGQGVANVFNGVQDLGIGILNLPARGVNGIAWLEEKAGILDENDPLRVPYIPSPDWSRGLITQEYGEADSWSDTHGWSKFSGGVGAACGVTAAALKLLGIGGAAAEAAEGAESSVASGAAETAVSQGQITRLLSQAEQATQRGFEAARNGDIAKAKEFLKHASELTELVTELLGL